VVWGSGWDMVIMVGGGRPWVLWGGWVNGGEYTLACPTAGLCVGFACLFVATTPLPRPPLWALLWLASLTAPPSYVLPLSLPFVSLCLRSSRFLCFVVFVVVCLWFGPPACKLFSQFLVFRLDRPVVCPCRPTTYPNVPQSR